jgi:RNA polymerase sigma factor (sigma-70 family)
MGNRPFNALRPSPRAAGTRAQRMRTNELAWGIVVANEKLLAVMRLRAWRLVEAVGPDWKQIARLGLFKAALYYDETRGFRFSSFAVPCMYAVLVMAAKRQRRRCQRLVGHSLPANSDWPDPRDELTAWENSEDARELLPGIVKILPARYLEVLGRSYGLFGYEKEPCQQLCARFGVTRARIDQLRKNAIDKVRRYYREKITPG